MCISRDDSKFNKCHTEAGSLTLVPLKSVQNDLEVTEKLASFGRVNDYTAKIQHCYLISSYTFKMSFVCLVISWTL